MINIVLGAGFGDEGKGHVVDKLVNSPADLVIRFSGGQQAGHTVYHSPTIKHSFSNFGSGTLKGATTFWSNFCTFDPVSVVKEFEKLTLLQIHPLLMVDPLSMVTTPYDILMNRQIANNKTNTCGMGIGTTMQRNKSMYKLYVQDLLYNNVMVEKLNNIREYYYQRNTLVEVIDNVKSVEEQWMKIFLEYVEKCLQIIKIIPEHEILQKQPIKFNNIVFEGSQGILLDQDHGFPPEVTWAYTTSKNAMEIIKRNRLQPPNIYYVSRVYQSRHGDGYMTNQHIPVILKNNENENNVENKYQGKFRTSTLDLDLLNYAILCDSNFLYTHNSKNMVFTCRDQVDNITFTYEKNSYVFTDFPDLLTRCQGNMQRVYTTNSPQSDLILV
jgi:adenylosuccinate synthase